MTAPLICLITPGHLSSTPRLLKEADALVDAGYRVHVVYARHYTPIDLLDEQVLSSARWTCTSVDCRKGAAVFLRKLLRKSAQYTLQSTPWATIRLAARAHHAAALHLGSVAAKIPADLYLGHCLAGLPAAALAANQRGVPYGFDLEDFHDAETTEASIAPAAIKATRFLQLKLLPGCRHLTASSGLIAQKYTEIYGVRPEVVLNVFPRAQAPASPFISKPITTDHPASLYWFSQTVGPGRGLEAVVAIMGHMRTPVELHLRGFVSPDYSNHLQSLARTVGLKHPVRFLCSGPSVEMARLSASANLGLSTEEPPPLNRDLCLTNKIFVYLLAGIPQLLSRTAAQSELAIELGEAGLLVDLTDAAGTAQQLDAFLADPARMETARKQAWNLAQMRYCWDLEKEKFLGSIRHIVGPEKP